jgi:hypothetical protein
MINMSNSKVGELVFPLVCNQINFDNDRKGISELIYGVYLKNPDRFVTSLAYLKIMENKTNNKVIGNNIYVTDLTCYMDVRKKLNDGKHERESTMIDDYTEFFEKFIKFYKDNVRNNNPHPTINRSTYNTFVNELNDFLRNHNICLPFKQYSDEIIQIKKFTYEYTQFSSITKPIKMNFESCLDGKTQTFSLILKKDKSSVIEVMTANILNQLNNLYSKTTDNEMKLYNIFQINQEIALVEFINNIYPLRDAAEEIKHSLGVLSYDEFDEKNIFRKNYLYLYFIKNNPDPNDYFRHKMNYIKSYATSSMACYLVGLGDRHTSNIFFYNDGNILNIDYGYSLHTSIKLPTPEIILTRLTHNITFAFGLFKENGHLFSYSLQALQTLKNYTKVISIIFNAYINTINDNNLKGSIERTFSKAMSLLSGESLYELTNLISTCTSAGNLKMMFSGWSPGL